MQNTTRSKEHHNSKLAYQPSYSVSQTPKGLQSQEKVYQFLREYIAEYGYAPSVRDICVGTGLTSTSSVYLHLRNLAKAGLIRKTGNQPRSLVLVEDYPATTIAEMAKAYVAEGKQPQATLSESSQQLFDIMVGLVKYGRSLVPGNSMPAGSR